MNIIGIMHVGSTIRPFSSSFFNIRVLGFDESTLWNLSGLDLDVMVGSLQVGSFEHRMAWGGYAGDVDWEPSCSPWRH